MIQFKAQAEAKKSVSTKRKRIYIAIIIVGNALAFYLIYSSFFSQSKTPSFIIPPTDIGPTATGEPVAVGAEGSKSFFEQLKNDFTILNDPRFRVLRSLGIEIKIPTPGRENPFQPY